MVDALKFACEQKAIYPQVGVTVFKVWIVILAFVSIQLSWNLRPFLANKTEEFKMFRNYEGNFYTAIVYSFEQLLKSKETPRNSLPSAGISDTLKHTQDTGLIQFKDIE